MAPNAAHSRLSPLLSLMAVLMMVCVTACSGGDGAGEVTTAAAASAENTDLAAKAEAAAGEYIAAEAAADVDAVLGMLQPSLADKERQRYGFFAAWPMHRVGDCEVSQASSFLSAVECQAELTDPVWRHIGATDIVVTYNTWSDGMTFDFGGDYTGNGVVATPNTYSDTVTAYADYLMTHSPNEYATACDPAAFDVNETVQEYGLTLVPACGALVASVGDEAAAWLEAGRPAP